MQRRFLQGFSSRTLTVLLTLIFLSESVVSAGGKNLQLAQTNTPANQNTQTENQKAAQRVQKLFEEAEQLSKQQTPDSLQRAMQKYEEILQIARKLGDRLLEHNTLYLIGSAYSERSEHEKALTYYQQALNIIQELKKPIPQARTLWSIATSYSYLWQKQKALEYYNQALSIFQAEKANDMVAIALLTMGMVYENIGESKKALDYVNQALTIQRSQNDSQAQTTTFSILAGIYNSLGEKQKALSCLNQALEIHRQRNNLDGQADILTKMSTIYVSLDDYLQARELLNQALQLNQKGSQSNLVNQVTIFLSLGVIYVFEGNYQQALNYYNQARSLSQKIVRPDLEATVLSQIKHIYESLGQLDEALAYLKAAQKLQQKINDRSAEASTLNSIAKLYQSQGEYQTALNIYNQALEIQRQIKDIPQEARTLGNIAYLYRLLGEYQLSLDNYNQALKIFEKIENNRDIAQIMTEIGLTYLTAKDYDNALKYYNQALPLWRQQGQIDGEILTLIGLTKTYDYLKDYQQALSAANQGLSLAREKNNLAFEVTMLGYQATAYQRLGDYQKALSLAQEAVTKSQKVGARQVQANALYGLGDAYKDLKEYQKAIDAYKQELTIRQEIGDRNGQAHTLYRIAQTERDRDRLASARSQIEAAIAILENIRTQVTSQDLRTSYFASVQRYYELYIDLLMQLHKQQPSQGYHALALQASERARARTLLELLTEANADIRQGVDPQLLAAERNLQQQLDALEKRRLKLLSGKYTPTQAQNLEQETASILEQYRQLQAKIRATSPRYAALTQPQTLSLQQIQSAVLDENTLLLEYSLGEERSYLWAVTKNSISSYELPKRAEIAAAVEKLRNIVTVRIPRKGDKEAKALSELILAPVAQQLGQRRLVIVADGVLQYVPFAALHTPNSTKNSYEPLAVNHEIVTLPSASTIAVLRQETTTSQTAPKTLAVIADPIFSASDERVKGTTPSQQNNNQNLDLQQLSKSARTANIEFRRLPFTRQEAETILSLVPERERKQAFDFAANRATATDGELSQYRIVHFATHGILNSENPELSGVVLSLFDENGKPQNGFLRLHDIFNLKLPAELVVLSACETGLGEEVKGEGLIGLTRGFMYAGSSRVVVSLWNVDDEATAELMKKFYKFMLEDKLKPAAALRSAQIEMWRDPKYRAPYFWAAFTLQGEWR
ncbi:MULTISPECIES: CHAT domain-containing protein [Calothrix]|uniref:Tetratricopeptide repeat protein n=2 Tax=Calothrix TaxID=1186 RepID=A0ABR8A7A4_9CYAN|nr:MULTISPECIES: CHAT domain-containing protein [Calothrix]MBD2195158.1 tetratricopeptide repeat protein [Calothrix parietina FACHB-288]MBD2223871.1 tetratricopeptide repeat protein [Calothrix anomala FACHB-343]